MEPFVKVKLMWLFIAMMIVSCERCYGRQSWATRNIWYYCHYIRYYLYYSPIYSLTRLMGNIIHFVLVRVITCLCECTSYYNLLWQIAGRCYERLMRQPFAFFAEGLNRKPCECCFQVAYDLLNSYTVLYWKHSVLLSNMQLITGCKKYYIFDLTLLILL